MNHPTPVNVPLIVAISMAALVIFNQRNLVMGDRAVRARDQTEKDNAVRLINSF